MLDAFIIEEIKRRERERSERQRPVLEIERREEDDDDDTSRRSEQPLPPNRGVVHIEV